MRVNAKILEIFRPKNRVDFRFREKSQNRKAEHGQPALRSAKVPSVGGMNRRTVPICSSAGVREAELGRSGVAENETAHEWCNRNGRDGGKRVPTLPSRVAWRAGRHWPRSRETEESITQPRAHTKAIGHRRTSRSTTGSGKSSPLPPQQPRGQQQRKPTKIKKKLHTKRPRAAEDNSTTLTRCNCLKIIRIAQRQQVTCVPDLGLAGGQKTTTDPA